MTKRTSPLTAKRPRIQGRGGWTAEGLSLRQLAPRDWHHDPPAYAGDPYMDWESTPERPANPGWSVDRDRQNTSASNP